MKQSWRERGGDVTLCYTLVTISIRVSGAHTAHLHWTVETLDTPDKDNTQPAAKLIDDTQNSNYEAFLYRALKEQNLSTTTRKQCVK